MGRLNKSKSSAVLRYDTMEQARADQNLIPPKHIQRAYDADMRRLYCVGFRYPDVLNAGRKSYDSLKPLLVQCTPKPCEAKSALRVLQDRLVLV